MAETSNNLSGKRKLALVGLAVFGIFLVILWAVTLKNEITSPLNFYAANNQPVAADQSSDEKLKQQDTDGDGLSDWDELNVYHTSRYVADSDSDGIPDGVEVKNGTDPNCPQGANCQATSPVNSSATSSGPTSSPSSNSSSAINNLASSSQADLNKIFSCQDATLLRGYLLNSGSIDQKSLDALSDADLLQMCHEQLNKNATSTK